MAGVVSHVVERGERQAAFGESSRSGRARIPPHIRHAVPLEVSIPLSNSFGHRSGLAIEPGDPTRKLPDPVHRERGPPGFEQIEHERRAVLRGAGEMPKSRNERRVQVLHGERREHQVERFSKVYRAHVAAKDSHPRFGGELSVQSCAVLGRAIDRIVPDERSLRAEPRTENSAVARADLHDHAGVARTHVATDPFHERVTGDGSTPGEGRIGSGVPPPLSGDLSGRSGRRVRRDRCL